MKSIIRALVCAVSLAVSFPAIAQNAARPSAFTPTAVAASLVVCSSACSLSGVQFTTGASAGWVFLFNGSAVPADGTVAPIKWWQIAANTTRDVPFATPISMPSGAVLVFSTTGPFTKTGSATAVFAADIQ